MSVRSKLLQPSSNLCWYACICWDGKASCTSFKPTQSSRVDGWVLQQMEMWGNQIQLLLDLWLCIPATVDSHLLVVGEECVSQMAHTLVKLQDVMVCFCPLSDLPVVLVSNLYTANTCPQLSDPENGNVRQPNPALVGSVAVYTCNRGFNLVGSRTRVCQSDLGYSSTAPTCERMCIDIEKSLVVSYKPIHSYHLWAVEWSSQWECEAAKSSSR